MNLPNSRGAQVGDTPADHHAKWNIDISTAIVIAGAAIKSTFITILIIDGEGLLAGVPVAIWLIFLLCLASRLGEVAYRLILFAVSIGLAILLYADLLHIRGFGSTLDIMSAVATPNVSGLGASIVALMRPWDVLLFLDVALALLAHGLRGRIQSISISAPRRLFSYPVAVAGVVYLAISASQIIHIPISPHQYLTGVGPVGVHANQVLSRVPWWSNKSLSDAERKIVASWFDRNSIHAGASPEYDHLFGVLDGRDTYLIVVESLEGGVINLDVDGQEVTPNLNAIEADSLVFPEVVQQTRDGNTSDAELMFLTGMYPMQSGSVFLKHPDTHFPITLPQLLSDKGYATVAIHGDTANFWNRQFVFPHLGFEDYISEQDFATRAEIGMGIADESLFDQAIIERERVIGPSFMMLTTLTSHFPWTMPQALQNLDLERNDLTASYLQSLHYVDREIGDFVEGLASVGRLDKSALIIVGDHEGIHKYDPDGTWIRDNEKRLPFMVYIPGVGGEVVSNPGGQVDILPTLAHLFGVRSSDIAGRVMGRNLLGPNTGSTIDSNGESVERIPVDDLLREAHQVSELVLRGDYFANLGKVATSEH